MKIKPTDIDQPNAIATVQINATDPAGADLTVTNGVAYFRVPSTMNGMNLIAVAAAVITASSSGAVQVQIRNVTQAANMLTTVVSIDASETDSLTAATPAVVNTSEDDVATGNILRIDVTGAGTGARGLIVELQFRLP